MQSYHTLEPEHVTNDAQQQTMRLADHLRISLLRRDAVSGTGYIGAVIRPKSLRSSSQKARGKTRPGGISHHLDRGRESRWKGQERMSLNAGVSETNSPLIPEAASQSPASSIRESLEVRNRPDGGKPSAILPATRLFHNSCSFWLQFDQLLTIFSTMSTPRVIQILPEFCPNRMK